MHWLLAPVAFMESCRRRHGDAFTVRFVGFEQPMVLISDPAAIRALYAQREQRLPPGRFLTLRPMVGPDSLLLIEGAGHLERRRMMLPPFHGERMRGFEETMREIAESEIAAWPEGGEVALQPLTRALTLEVILRLVAGVTDPGRLERMRALIPHVLDAGTSVSISVRVLIAGRLRRSDPLAALSEQIRELDGHLLDEIAERRARGQGDGEDVLSMLLAARFEDGGGMSDWELRDQIVTLLVAGHETTATALAWAFDLLTHNGPALERLIEEVRGGERDDWMRAVIAETLRLRPIVPLAGRRLAAELECDGFTLPAGTDVSPAIWLTHTRADLYEAPYAFRPERFLEEPPATYAWIPFGGGVRRCLGAAFAELEMRVVLRAVLERFELTSTHGSERVMRRGPTLAPRHGTRVRLRRVHTSSDGRSPRSASASSTRGSAAAVRRHEPSEP
jgi:cytochrome P450